jgi:hypothetical protein
MRNHQSQYARDGEKKLGAYGVLMEGSFWATTSAANANRGASVKDNMTVVNNKGRERREGWEVVENRVVTPVRLLFI